MKTAKGICIVSILGLLAAFVGGSDAALLSPTSHPNQTVLPPAGSGADIGQEPQVKQTEPAFNQNEFLTRTYELKHISAEEFMKVAKIFVNDFTERGSTLVVWIRRSNIENFESLLKKLDVEKKTIQLNIYAVYAHRDLKLSTLDEKNPSPKKTTADSGSSPASTRALDKIKNIRVNRRYGTGPAQAILESLAELAGLNIVFEVDANFPVTSNFVEIPWTDAVETILKQRGLGYSIEGDELIIISLRKPTPELKKVLDELKALWNFTSYDMDGPSFITVRESAGSADFKLVMDHTLNLSVTNVKVKGEEIGKRTVSIERLKLAGSMNFVDSLYIDTPDVSVKEKGFLVAGVSGFGSAADALILVISAEIK